MMKSIVLTATCLSLSLAACASRQGVPSTATPSQPKFTLDEAEARPTRINVQKGDTVYALAYKYGITSRSIIAANNLQPPYTLLEGQELELPSPQEHVVIEGEDARGVAAFYGVDLKVLARENRLGEDFKVQPGDRLIIPTKDTVANAQEDFGSTIQSTPIASSSLAPLSMAGVQPQQDADSKSDFDLAAEIGRERMGRLDIQSELQRELQAEHQSNEIPAVTPVAAPEASAKAANETQDDDSNSTVPVPPVKEVAAGTAAVAAVAVDAVSKSASSSSSSVPNPIAKPAAVAAVSPTTPSAPAAAKVAPAVAAPRSGYIWPAKGDVVATFGQTINGAKNDGVNIALPAGSTVQSVAAGEVVYSGDALKGFGNLVLVKHSDGYMSAYGHNSKLLVKKGDKVTQGQKIAESGSTGDVKTPQLHFELRKGTQPIDPMPKLGS